jgi:hypothetical protein
MKNFITDLIAVFALFATPYAALWVAYGLGY